MDLNSEFDFLSFWTKGGFQFEYSNKETAQRVIDYCQKESFSRDYNGNIPVDIVSWDTDWGANETAPPAYQQFRDQLLESPLLKSYCRIYGDFTFSKIMFHRTPRNYINDYHTHSYDGSHFHIFFYVCPGERTHNDGGLIELGEVVDKESVKFDPVGFYHQLPKMNLTHLSFVPQTGLAMVVNNINPYFRHRVTEVLSDKPRHTLMIAFGYKDNCTKNKDIANI